LVDKSLGSSHDITKFQRPPKTLQKCAKISAKALGKKIHRKEVQNFLKREILSLIQVGKIWEHEIEPTTFS
jgi:hypothetical protein